jgi:hypothetical protein
MVAFASSIQTHSFIFSAVSSSVHRDLCVAGRVANGIVGETFPSKFGQVRTQWPVSLRRWKLEGLGGANIANAKVS